MAKTLRDLRARSRLLSRSWPPLLSRSRSSLFGGGDARGIETLAYEEVRAAPDRPYNATAIVLHGLMGAARNWRLFSRNLAAELQKLHPSVVLGMLIFNPPKNLRPTARPKEGPRSERRRARGPIGRRAHGPIKRRARNPNEGRPTGRPMTWPRPPPSPRNRPTVTRTPRLRHLRGHDLHDLHDLHVLLRLYKTATRLARSDGSPYKPDEMTQQHLAPTMGRGDNSDAQSHDGAERNEAIDEIRNPRVETGHPPGFSPLHPRTLDFGSEVLIPTPEEAALLRKMSEEQAAREKENQGKNKSTEAERQRKEAERLAKQHKADLLRLEVIKLRREEKELEEKVLRDSLATTPVCWSMP